MWGSSFADLAKKAQELQEQASSISTGELFNLDAMQSAKQKPDNMQHNTVNSNDISTVPADTKPTQTNTPKKAPFALPSLGESAAIPVATPKAHVAPAQKGKLKIVKKKSPKLGAVKLTTTTNKVPELSLPDTSDTKPEPSEKIHPKSAPTSPALLTNEDQQQSTPKPYIGNQNKEETEPEKLNERAEQPGDYAISTEENKTKAQTNPVNPANKQDEASGLLSASDVPLTSDGDTSCKQKGPHVNNAIQSKPCDESPMVASVSQEEFTGPKELPSTDNQENKASTTQSNSDDRNKSMQTAVEVETENQACEVSTDATAEEEVQTMNPDKQEETKDAEERNADNADVDTKNEKDPIPDETESGGKNETSDVNNTVSEAKDGQKETARPEPTTKADSSPAAPTTSSQPGVDSDRVMQQFTAQLQRLEANFETERKEMQLEHQRNIEQAIALKEEEMMQVREGLKEKDLKVRELLRIKEGNELRMDSLKREVQGIKELLKQRDDDIKKAKEAGKSEKCQLEQKIRSMELDQGKKNAEVKSLKEELENSRGKLGETSDEYTNLKSRVKLVAGELKDRRAECRELKGKIEELEDQNATLQDQISTLDSQLSDRDRSGTEKDEEANNLRAEIEKLKRKVKEKEKSMEEQEDAHEKILGSYKKKAQNSLAVANARAAAAIQSKEEAELEARAARGTADASLESARTAESNGQKAMAEAKEYYKEMEKAKTESMRQLETCKSDLESTKKSFDELKSKWDILVTEKERLGAENAKQVRDMETERFKASNLQQELAQAQRRGSSLQDDISELRVQLAKAESRAEANAKKPSTLPGAETSSVATVSTSTEDSTSKATLIMMQKQLQEANQTIEELKDALENAVEINKKPMETDATLAPQGPENGGNGMGAPLFYAMEKQAELNTARNEINRLASLYADVQSEKVEAEDELKTVRRELDEERAKLQRYEKLVAGRASNGAGSPANGHQPAANSGRTNIEYLKNIMMSYLHAKTLAERKALVPVIGAVLCLTPDEQAKAISNIEASGGMEGFSSAFFETLGSKVGR